MSVAIVIRGRQNKIVGQTGEYLVAAELSRRGLIATTFTGNLPYYDIVASDETGRHVSVQVKTISRGSWQFGDVRKYFDVKFSGKRQSVHEIKACPIRRLVYVFVRLDGNGNDRFYVLTWQDLASLMRLHHATYLQKHGGVRPKRWDSLHCSLSESELSEYQDKWETVEKNLN
jgi:Holliday junction resolvase-like predicted endonuclease